MTVFVFFAVLGAALLHAFWNALIKIGQSRISVMLILSVVQGFIGFLVIFISPWPNQNVWIWLAGSGLAHTAYKTFLTYAYEQGDLSRVYPIARGAAPMAVLAFSLFFLTDPIKISEYFGVAILGLGILLMARGIFTSGESRRLLPFALGSALATASYSIIDGLGARISGDAVGYVGWLFMIDGVMFALITLVTRGPRAFIVPRQAWIAGSIASAASYGAYAIAVWAMTVAPIALVTALRETSILFAVLIGWLIYKEQMGLAKICAAGLIVAGVIITRI